MPESSQDVSVCMGIAVCVHIWQQAGCGESVTVCTCICSIHSWTHRYTHTCTLYQRHWALSFPLMHGKASRENSRDMGVGSVCWLFEPVQLVELGKLSGVSSYLWFSRDHFRWWLYGKVWSSLRCMPNVPVAPIIGSWLVELGTLSLYSWGWG